MWLKDFCSGFLNCFFFAMTNAIGLFIFYLKDFRIPNTNKRINFTLDLEKFCTTRNKFRFKLYKLASRLDQNSHCKEKI